MNFFATPSGGVIPFGNLGHWEWIEKNLQKVPFMWDHKLRQLHKTMQPMFERGWVRGVIYAYSKQADLESEPLVSKQRARDIIFDVCHTYNVRLENIKKIYVSSLSNERGKEYSHLELFGTDESESIVTWNTLLETKLKGFKPGRYVMSFSTGDSFWVKPGGEIVVLPDEEDPEHSEWLIKELGSKLKSVTRTAPSNARIEALQKLFMEAYRKGYIRGWLNTYGSYDVIGLESLYKLSRQRSLDIAFDASSSLGIELTKKYKIHNDYHDPSPGSYTYSWADEE